jgi:hypothetical protein
MISIEIHDREDLDLLIEVLRDLVLLTDLVERSKQTTLHDHEGC